MNFFIADNNPILNALSCYMYNSLNHIPQNTMRCSFFFVDDVVLVESLKIVGAGVLRPRVDPNEIMKTELIVVSLDKHIG